MDLTELSDYELFDLRRQVREEQERRHKITSAPAVINRANADYLTATGVETGQPWRQPTGAHDAYPAGWQVEHDGKTWEPGMSGWREVGGAPEWVQPTGGHDAYNIVDRVTFEGRVYESTIAANTWSPTAYPAGWQLIEEQV